MPHLRKKTSAGSQNNFFAAEIAKEAFIESVSEFVLSEEDKVVDCEIDQSTWSVVSFGKLEAGGLTYAQATQLIGELETNNVAGLCIVTDAAASHIAN